MVFTHKLLCCLLCIFSFFINNTFAAVSLQNIPGQLEIEIHQKPMPLAANNKYYLMYELYLTNFQDSPITLTSLEITASKTKFKYTGNELTTLINPIGITNTSKELAVFQPGISKIIYVWLPFDTWNTVPENLMHSITFKTKELGKNTVFTVLSLPMLTDKTKPMVVTPPLRGNNWAAMGAPSNTTYHRGPLIINGQVEYGERYAIDFVQIGKNGLTYKKDEFKNSDYYCYGTDIYAVATGKIISVRDGMPENVPHKGTMAVPFTLENGLGNYIFIEIAPGVYAFYGHLLPGSIKVKVGNKVNTGDVIAKLGNTGHSLQPHLHFEIVKEKISIADGKSIPYAFTQFYMHESKLWVTTNPHTGAGNIHMKIFDTPVKKYENQLMLEAAVIDFP